MVEVNNKIIVTGNERAKIGVYICHCGANIGGVVSIPDLIKYSLTLPNVEIAQEYKFFVQK